MSIFRKPLENWKRDDVASVIGSAESDTVEFKQDLAVESQLAKQGRQDAWHSGGKLGKEAKKDIAKEIVAFANSGGGHLLLGISEYRDDEQSLADEIFPIPRVVKLASQFQDSLADAIEPKLLTLKVRGIETDGDKGVVVFSVRPSISAPHRSTFDWKCYSRRWDRSEAMTMHEIQELTRSRDRQEERIRSYLSEACGPQANLVGEPKAEDWPVRISLAATLFEMSDCPDFEERLRSCQERWRLGSGSESLPSEISFSYPQARPILGGLRWQKLGKEVEGTWQAPYFVDVESCGRMASTFGLKTSDQDGKSGVYLGQAAGSILTFFKAFQLLVRDVPEGMRACWMLSVLTADDSPTNVLPYHRFQRLKLSELRTGKTTTDVMEFSLSNDLADIFEVVFRDLCHALGVEDQKFELVFD